MFMIKADDRQTSGPALQWLCPAPSPGGSMARRHEVQVCVCAQVDRAGRPSPLLGAIWRRPAVVAVSSVFPLNYVGGCEM